MNAPNASVRFGVFEVDFAARELRKRGIRIKIQDQPFRVLEALLERPGEIVTREALKDRLWANDEFVEFDKSLNTAVQKIRLALGDSAGASRFLETIPRVGYRFVAPVQTSTDRLDPPSDLAPGTPAAVGIRPVGEAALKRMSPNRWVLLAVGWLLAATLAFVHFTQEPPDARPRPVNRFSLTPVSLNSQPSSTRVALSPDGRYVAYVSGDDPPELWVRAMDREEPYKLEDTKGARYGMFWSPDSRLVGFATDSHLKRVAVDGGPAVTICPLPGSNYDGGAWSPDGKTIVFSAGTGPPLLYEASASGGPSRLLFEPNPAEMGPRNEEPWFLPSGAASAALLFSAGSRTERNVYLRNLENGEVTKLAEGMRPLYSATGHILYQSSYYEGGLWALPFSIRTLKPTAQAFLVAEGASDPSVSDEGTLIYLPAVRRKQELVWYGRDGTRLQRVGRPHPQIDSFDASPDGKLAVLAVDGDIYVDDLDRAVSTRLTITPERETTPVWTPWGAVFTRNTSALFFRPVDLSLEIQTLFEGDGRRLFPYGVDATGGELLYGVAIQSTLTNTGQVNDFDIFRRQREVDGRFSDPEVVLAGPAETVNAQISPDGRSVAYSSRAERRWNVFIQPYPEGGPRVQVTPDGGNQVRWNPSGNELFFVSGDALYAVDLGPGPELNPGKPRPLFRNQKLANSAAARPRYAVGPSGNRFLLIEDAPEEGPLQPSVHVVQNWSEEFRGREQD